MSRNRNFTYDAQLSLSDGATAVTATAPAQVGGVNKTLFIGGGPVSTAGGPQDYGMFQGYLVIDLLTVDAGTLGLYTVSFQLSNDSAFGSGNVVKTAVLFGNTTALPGGGATSTAGRYVAMVDNVGVEGTVYGYCRILTVVGGTVSTGTTFKAFLSPIMH